MLVHTVEISRSIRRVRGGSQAYLVEGQDGHAYVAKFQRNPQGTRTLVNEWIAHWFFKTTAVATPEIRVLRLSQKVIEEGNLHFTMGSRTVPVNPGLHFGSQCPVNVNCTAIFDFLPSTCFHLIGNVEDFGRALVLDVLLGQTDSRQAIFARDSSRRGHKPAVRAYFIDHGLIFGGGRWEIEDRSFAPKGMHAGVYALMDLKSVCCDAIKDLKTIVGTDLLPMVRSIPDEWLAPGDREDLNVLIQQVLKRRNRLETLIQSHIETLFDWTHRHLPAVHEPTNTFSAESAI